MKSQIRKLAEEDHYKYKIYVQYNPTLAKSRFIDLTHPSHKLPIETGRWNRTPRNEHIC